MDDSATAGTAAEPASGRVGSPWRSTAVAAQHGLRRLLVGADYPPVRPWLSRWPRLALLARPGGALVLVVLCVITVEYLTDTRRLPTEVAWVLGILTVAPLPLLVTRPLAAWRVTLLGLLFGTFNRVPAEYFPWNPTQLVMALLVLAVVAPRVDGAVAAWIGVLTAVPVWLLGPPSARPGLTILLAFLLLGGETVRRLRRAQGALETQTQVSEREQARRAVLEERARIARELHDVVAHHMSMLAVRAETAPYRLAEVPEPARAEFGALAQAARDALTDMRRLLGVLRSDAAAPQLTPQPDLGSITGLIDAARRAGVTVHYLPPVAGAQSRPPGSVALAGFRIVQEALANATRHAPGAPVTVQVWPGTHELSVRVHNTAPEPTDPPTAVGAAAGRSEPADASGAGAPGDPPVDGSTQLERGSTADTADIGGGHGVAGMRERVELLGGYFAAEPTPDGGFSVIAVLPYETGRDARAGNGLARATGGTPDAGGTGPAGGTQAADRVVDAPGGRAVREVVRGAATDAGQPDHRPESDR